MRTHFPSLALLILCLASPSLAADYSGKVLSPDGKPVKNAAVYLFTGARTPQSTVGIDAPTTRSDDNGDYHFSNAPADASQLMATADGFGAGAAQVQAGQKTKIALHPRTDLLLTFIGPDNKPAVGVPISLSTMSFSQIAGGSTNLSIPQQFNSPIFAATDSNGQCTIAGLAQSSTVDLIVTDPKYAMLSDQDEQMLGSSPQTKADPIHLLPAATISGHVTDSTTGKPASGIAIDCQSSDYGYASALTAADGSYTIKQLRPGRFIISLHPDSTLEKTFTAQAVENLPLTAGQAKTAVDLSLIPGVILTGTVVAADNNQPVPGVPLGIYGPAHPRDSASVQQIQTDATGTFTARVVPGEQNVYIMSDTPAPGFARPSPDNKNVTIQQGGASEAIQFKLPRVLMAPLVGKVLDPDGNPVAGASVFISSDEIPMYQHMSFTTGPDGIFHTLPMQRTGRVQLRARSGDLATSKALAVSRSAPGDITIQLEKGVLATITGRVVDSQNQPIPAAQISLIVRNGRYSMEQDSGLSDDKGNYTIADLWPDAIYYVDVSRNGYGETETAELRPTPGQTLTPRDITLYKRDSSVAGLLLNADNQPVVGMRIYINGPRTGYNSMTTDGSGKFSCTVVTGDRLTAFYNYAPQRGYSRSSVRSGDQSIVLHTAPPRVLTPPSAPLVVAPAAQPAAATPEPLAQVSYDPSDATTWRAWAFSAVLVVVGGIITLLANLIASLKPHKTA
jgi:protocatechuate 3,4-dioxygenase beta subunit